YNIILNSYELIFIINISMTSNSKLIFFDVDGTLLNDKKTINESTIKAIEELKHHDYIFCLATGRCLSQNIIDIANLAGLNGFLVLANGNYIWDLKNEILTTLGLPLDRKIIHRFYELAKETKRQLNICFLDGTSKNYYFGNDINEITDHRFFIFGPTTTFSPIEELEEDLEKQILHIAIKAESNIIKKINDKFDDIRLSQTAQISNVADIYIEADSYGISKWNGCIYVQKKLSVSNENTYAFGDSENDLIILKNVGNPVLMGNASDSMKNEINNIIDDNNSDGIAKYLLSLIKNKE
ncbi:MAG: HAD family hydrolase, partial [Ureaplasma sp.]|nr:HAD family hydrolase [Ureaplasma sp.]